ncbi:MAG: EFR1 family ferrodoxin [Eubacteriales bacterium]|nr:EFR1 family ferrodoxin [Eubacteriales bacterium]
MIYFFSGTGNSRWIAEELARLTGEQALSIPDLVKDGPTAVYAGAGSSIGIVFPVYAWGAPLLVEQFCKAISVSEGAYVYAVCTCGDEAGFAMRRLKRFYPLQAAWSFTMPNNYIVGFDVDAASLEQKKIDAARERLGRVSAGILARKTEFDVHTGPAAWLKTAVIRPMFNTFARRTKPFYATSDCNGCGICERGCPTETIVMRQGRPAWVNRNCAQCMACINRCPKKAIQYGTGTLHRGRYYFGNNKTNNG